MQATTSGSHVSAATFVSAGHEHSTIIGTSVYFHVPNDTELFANLGGGSEAWAGYKQSVRPCQYGLSLNIDVAATALLAAKCLPELVADILRLRNIEDLRRGLDRRSMNTLKESLKGVRISIDRQGQKYKKTICGFSERGADQTKFFNEKENREMSVAEYFQTTYKLRLQQPTCLALMYPWYLARRAVPGQRRRVLDDRQTTSMLAFAALPPGQRKAFIDSVLQRPDLAGFNQDPTIRAFGIQVSQQMKTVKARLLPQPRLAYGRPEAIDPGRTGSWNLRDVCFPNPCEIKSWAFVSLMRMEEVDIPGPIGIRDFLRALLDMLNKCGIKCGSMPELLFCNPQASVEQHLTRAADMANKKFNLKCELILVLLPVKSAGPYREVKQASDSVLGIASQCFVAGKAGVGRDFNKDPNKGRLQYCANLALKINAKRGGVNVKLAGDRRVIPVINTVPYILFGADVNHPTGFDKVEPSISAVTASMTPSLGQYAARIMKQTHRKEVIENMQEAAQDLLVKFYQTNGGKKPQAIVYYRDGVAQGQFEQVLQEEYNAIRRACNTLEEGYTPPITFIVVQKRHKTRLFPANPGAADRSGNVMPGTVIDRDICHPTQFDLNLNSHAGLQGSNKAAHYHVLVDENGFSADALQIFTNWLCYLYCRCTRSVSYVPPAYYAHLAALRGRLMVQLDDSASEASGQSRATFMDLNKNMTMGVMHYV
eukprot:jgi/Chrzof1/3608/Cz13g02060.t1